MTCFHILTSSYCCCRLRTGCLLIGVLGLIAGVIGLIYFAFQAANWTSYTGDLGQVVLILLALASAFLVIASILLLFGTYHCDSGCLLGYLILSIIVIVLGLATILAAATLVPWYILLLAALFALLLIYHWIIVFSYYILMLTRDDCSDLCDGNSIFQCVHL